jgi:hypothetical protein
MDFSQQSFHTASRGDPALQKLAGAKKNLAHDFSTFRKNPGPFSVT